MLKEDVAHLARLARLELSDAELERLPAELSSIMLYIDVISDIAADGVATTPEVGPLHNVFRTDKVTNEVGEYTDALLAEMPHTEGKFMKVKKILGGTD